MNTDNDDEYGENDLYNSWMKKLRKLPHLHPKSYSDKCGCFPPKKSNETNLNNNIYLNNIIQLNNHHSNNDYLNNDYLDNDSINNDYVKIMIL